MRPQTGTRSPIMKIVALGLLLALSALPLTACTGSADEMVGFDEGTAPQRDMAAEEYIETEAAPENLAGEAPAADSEVAKSSTAVDPSDEGDRLIIRNMSMRIEVDDVAASIEEVRAATSAAGGIISMMNVSTNDGPVYREEYDEYGQYVDGAPLSGYITVRVPAENLESFNEKIADLGKVLREDASQDDVTQQYVDLNARLENLQAREARLRELYDRAETIEDTLAVDRELSAVRGEIESMQAQILYLERQAAMATVTIELVEPTPVVSPGGENWGFVDAIRTSLRAFVATVNGLIIFLGAVLPIIILGLIGLAIVMAIVRIRRRRRAKNVPEQTAGQQYAQVPSQEETE